MHSREMTGDERAANFSTEGDREIERGATVFFPGGRPAGPWFAAVVRALCFPACARPRKNRVRRIDHRLSRATRKQQRVSILSGSQSLQRDQALDFFIVPVVKNCIWKLCEKWNSFLDKFKFNSVHAFFKCLHLQFARHAGMKRCRS
jgi:hypothetical protein